MENGLIGMGSKGQVGTEILVLVGMFLLLLLPLLLYAYNKAGTTGDDLSVQKAEFAASRLSTAVDSVGYLGGEAAIVEEIEIPPNVRNVTVNRNDIIFDMDVSGGRKEIVKSAAFTIKAEGFDKIKSSGTYFIEVAAVSNYSATSAEQVRMTVQ